MSASDFRSDPLNPIAWYSPRPDRFDAGMNAWFLTRCFSTQTTTASIVGHCSRPTSCGSGGSSHRTFKNSSSSLRHSSALELSPVPELIRSAFESVPGSSRHWRSWKLFVATAEACMFLRPTAARQHQGTLHRRGLVDGRADSLSPSHGTIMPSSGMRILRVVRKRLPPIEFCSRGCWHPLGDQSRREVV